MRLDSTTIWSQGPYLCGYSDENSRVRIRHTQHHPNANEAFMQSQPQQDGVALVRPWAWEAEFAGLWRAEGFAWEKNDAIAQAENALDRLARMHERRR